MMWKSETPAKPGWYWFKGFHSGEVEVIHLWMQPHGISVPGGRHASHMQGVWAGPLAPPPAEANQWEEWPHEEPPRLRYDPFSKTWHLAGLAPELCTPQVEKIIGRTPTDGMEVQASVVVLRY